MVLKVMFFILMHVLSSELRRIEAVNWPTQLLRSCLNHHFKIHFIVFVMGLYFCHNAIFAHILCVHLYEWKGFFTQLSLILVASSPIKITPSLEFVTHIEEGQGSIWAEMCAFLFINMLKKMALTELASCFVFK